MTAHVRNAVPTLVIHRIVMPSPQAVAQAIENAWSDADLVELPSEAYKSRGKLWACWTHHTDSNPCMGTGLSQ